MSQLAVSGFRVSWAGFRVHAPAPTDTLTDFKLRRWCAPTWARALGASTEARGGRIDLAAATLPLKETILAWEAEELGEPYP